MSFLEASLPCREIKYETDKVVATEGTEDTEDTEDSMAKARSSIQPRKRRHIEDGLAPETKHLSTMPTAANAQVVELLPPVQTGELATQIPSGQYTSGWVCDNHLLTVSNTELK